jgi:2'-5' RNA ligase
VRNLIHTKSRKTEKLYFIAIIPPEPVLGEVMELKHYFRDAYQSKASLNSPPHITLHMPFQWKEEKEAMLIKKIKACSKNFEAGEIQLSNFNAFPPRVIYIDVVKTAWLENMQKQLQRFCKTELNLFNANYKEHPYHPHITLAFRDLKKNAFRAAWEEFKNKRLEAVFKPGGITLLKHDGKVWKVLENFKFVNCEL